MTNRAIYVVCLTLIVLIVPSAVLKAVAIVGIILCLFL